MSDQLANSLLDASSLFQFNKKLLHNSNVKGLTMLMGLSGFAEAGYTVKQVSSELMGNLSKDIVAMFDVDQLIDYRARRPHITFMEDHFTNYKAPKLALYRLYDGLNKPFLFLTGLEPDFQWERFSKAILLLVKELEIKLIAWVHAIPMPVPHTRPLAVTVHGNRKDLISGISLWKPTVEIQSSITHLIELRLVQAGYKVAGYVIYVPHYLAEAEYPSSAVVALEYLGAATSLMLPTDKLRESSREVNRQIAEQVANSPDIQSVVKSLEERYDVQSEGISRRSLLANEKNELQDGETLGAAVEKYLSTQKSIESESDKNNK